MMHVVEKTIALSGASSAVAGPPSPPSLHAAVRPILLLTLGIALLQLAGCAALRLPEFPAGKSAAEKKRGQAEAAQPVSQVVCMWQPAEGRGLDEMPSRGFAGQIVFLTAASPTPVEVAGDVTVYLFDDQAPLAEQSRPLHVFRFVEGSWRAHLKSTAWGPTYQLFLPYVRKGAHRASCSLAVQIDMPDGRRVTSAMAKIILPGSESGGMRFSMDQQRFPAGRVLDPGDATRVVPASAQSPAAPATRRTQDVAPRFESYSIPYDFRRARAVAR